MCLLILILLTSSVYAEEDVRWVQECHVTDGQRECHGNLVGPVTWGGH